MRNDHLRLFIKAVDTGSFTKVGASAYLSTPSVLDKINALEREVGVRLLNRSTRGVTPTQAGAFLYQKAKELLSAEQEVIERTREIGSAHGDRIYMVRLGTASILPSTYVSSLVSAYPKLFDKFRIELRNFSESEYWRAINYHLGRDFDALVVTDCNLEQTDLPFGILVIGREPLMIAVPSGDPLEGKDMLCWDDLEDRRLLTLPQGMSWDIDKAQDDLLARQPSVNLVYSLSPYTRDVLAESCRQGVLALIPSGWTDLLPGYVVKPMRWEHTTQMGLFVPKEPSEAVVEFHKQLRKAVRARRRQQVAT